jgi:hypothetical protein
MMGVNNMDRHTLRNHVSKRYYGGAKDNVGAGKSYGPVAQLSYVIAQCLLHGFVAV